MKRETELSLVPENMKATFFSFFFFFGAPTSLC